MQFARFAGAAFSASIAGAAGGRADEKLTIALVKNSEMIAAQMPSIAFETQSPDIKAAICQVNVPSRVRDDTALQDRSADLTMIGACRAPIVGKQGGLLLLSQASRL